MRLRLAASAMALGTSAVASAASWVAVAAAAAAAAALLAGGCAGQATRASADLAMLTQWLPGFYDNQVQIAADRQAGRTPAPRRYLDVVPVAAEQLGSHVFYFEETTGGPHRRVVLARLAAFTADGQGIREALWSLTDPQRWRAADTTPELFQGLQPGDVRPLRGCVLTWHKQGARFTAANDPRNCRTVSPRTGAVASRDMRIELTVDEIAISDRPVSAAASAAGRGVEPEYVRFRRDTGP
ncbi:MAG: CpcT/CpeT family chromophore lyase [Steroidobacteraceae bacterium]